MYALFRRSILADCLNITSCWGADTAFVVKSLKYGKYDEVPGYLLFRRRGMSRNMRGIIREYNTRLGHILPFWDCTRDILGQPHVPWTLSIFVALAKLNALHTLWYLKSCAEDAIAWLLRLRRTPGRRERQATDALHRDDVTQCSQEGKNKSGTS